MGTSRCIAPEIKEQILKRIKDDGIPVAQAAKEHGIHETTVYVALGKGIVRTHPARIERPPERECHVEDARGRDDKVCRSFRIKKNGHQRGRQLYKCCQCGHQCLRSYRRRTTPSQALSRWEREFSLCREAYMFFEVNNAVFMILDFVIQRPLEIVVEIFCHNVEVTACFFAFLR